MLSLVGTKDTKLEQKRDWQSKDTMVALKEAVLVLHLCFIFSGKFQSNLPVF